MLRYNYKIKTILNLQTYLFSDIKGTSPVFERSVMTCIPLVNKFRYTTNCVQLIFWACVKKYVQLKTATYVQYKANDINVYVIK